MGPGVAILMFGIFLSIIGGVADAACSSEPTLPGGVAPNCGGFGALIGFGVLLLVVGIIVLLVQMRSRSQEESIPMEDPAVPPPLVTPVVIEKTVVRVRCRYCGEMVDPTAGTCPGCGAPI